MKYLILFTLLFISLTAILPFQKDCYAFEFEDLVEIEGAGNIEKKGNESKSALFANLCLIAFILANIYTLSRIVIENSGQDISGKDLRKKLSNLLSIHIILNTVAFVLTLAHAHYASATNPLFIIAEILLLLLIFGGIVLRYSKDLEFQKLNDILKAKKIFFGLIIFLIAVGHLISAE